MSSAAALGAAIALLLLFTASLTGALRRGHGAGVYCRCFDSSRHPVRRTHLARNSLLIGLAVFALPDAFASAGRPAVAELALALVGSAALTWIVVLWDDLTGLLRTKELTP